MFFSFQSRVFFQSECYCLQTSKLQIVVCSSSLNVSDGEHLFLTPQGQPMNSGEAYDMLMWKRREKLKRLTFISLEGVTVILEQTCFVTLNKYALGLSVIHSINNVTLFLWNAKSQFSEHHFITLPGEFLAPEIILRRQT